MGDYSLFKLCILGVIALLVIWSLRRSSAAANNSEAHSHGLSVQLSKNDVMSQLMIILSLGIFGLFLMSLNSYFGKIISGGSVALCVILLGIAAAYYFRLLGLAVLSLMALFPWWGYQGREWILASNGKWALVVAGFLILSLLYCFIGYATRDNRVLKRLAMAYMAFGSIGLSTILLIYSSETGLAELFKRSSAVSDMTSWQIGLTLGLGALAAAVMLAYANFKKSISLIESLGGLAFLALAVSLIYLPHDLYKPLLPGSYNQAYSLAARVWAILLNMALILEILIFLFLGYMRQKSTWINGGIIALFLILFVKYVDWFYHSIDKEFFFIGAGALLLLIGGAMEKGRRYLLARLPHPEHL